MKEPSNWVKKVHAAPPPLSTLHWEGKDPFSGVQIVNGAEMKCLKEAQVQASVSAGPAD